MTTCFSLIAVESRLVVVLVHDFLRRAPGDGGLVRRGGEPTPVIILNPDFAVSIGYIENRGMVLVFVVNCDLHVASTFLDMEQKGGEHKESRCIQMTHRQVCPQNGHNKATVVHLNLREGTFRPKFPCIHHL